MGRRKQASLIQDEPRPAQIDLGIGKAGSGAGQLLTYARALSRMSLIDWAPARRNRIGGRADPKRSEEDEIKIDQGKPLWRGARQAKGGASHKSHLAARRVGLFGVACELHTECTLQRQTGSS